jgi:hypothetical protein
MVQVALRGVSMHVDAVSTALAMASLMALQVAAGRGMGDRQFGTVRWRQPQNETTHAQSLTQSTQRPLTRDALPISERIA